MRRYRNDEIDFFAVYDPHTDSIYAVPPTDMGVGGWLRLDPVLNGQRKLIRWAADYTWEKHIAQLKAEAEISVQVS